MSKRGVALGVILGAGAAIGGMLVAKRHGILDYVQSRIDRIADSVEAEINKVVKMADDFEDETDALSRGITHMSEKEAKEFEERINMNKNSEVETASEKFMRLVKETREDEAESIIIEADEEEIFADTDDEKFEEPVTDEDDIDFDDDDVVADEDDFVTEDEDEDDDIESGITEDDITDAKEDSVVVEAELPSDDELVKVSEETVEEE